MPKHTLLVAALAVALAAPLSAAAETSADASGEASTLAAVRVTGSNIKRTDTEASNPVQVIGRQQLEQTGKATVADVLRSISANTGNASNETTNNGWASGSAGIGLRGLSQNAGQFLLDLETRERARTGIAAVVRRLVHPAQQVLALAAVLEAIGVDDPALDAEVIAIADEGYRRLGLTGHRIELTSLGDETCRPAYRAKLQEFLRGLPLDEDTQRRAELNPLRVLDDKRPEVRELVADAPLMVDHLSAEAKEHYESVKAHLVDLGVEFVENPRLVRGLDYYTKTTFEFVHDGLGAQSGIGGGGRYDGLMAELGGQELSGIGFGLGVDRTLLACQAEGLSVGDQSRCDVYCVPMGETAKRTLVAATGGLRAHGVRVDIAYGGKGLKGAMKAADRSGARFALVLGERPVAVLIRAATEPVAGSGPSIDGPVASGLVAMNRDPFAMRRMAWVMRSKL